MNNKGFISIMVLLIMIIILTLSSFLVHISSMQYLIVNAGKNNIQSYYSGEGKIYKLLFQDKYYNNEIFPRIKHYLKHGMLGTAFSRRFNMDSGDLMEEDKYREVQIAFGEEDKRRIMSLRTKSYFNGVTKTIESKFNIVRDLYELGEPILYDNVLEGDRKQEYIEYMNILQKKIGINELDNGIMGVESIDYDNIVILEDQNYRKYIDFYRDNINDPIKREYINKTKLFLIIRDMGELVIGTKEDTKGLELYGIIYSEGNIKINKDLDFYGILILNGGDITLPANINFNLEGIILSRDYPFGILEYESEININYNEFNIRTNGIYLPDYIHPQMKLLQIK